jgi:hypothetical protein
MATLQAARAYVLGLSMTSSKSFGLNRAIFYAAAKRGFKALRPPGPPKTVTLPHLKLPPAKVKAIVRSFKVFHLGDEMAYSVKVNGKLMFMIGQEVQTPAAFKKQIEGRFGKNFKKAWTEALDICRKADTVTLASQRYFYETVYKPRRDDLALKWSKG